MMTKCILFTASFILTGCCLSDIAYISHLTTETCTWKDDASDLPSLSCVFHWAERSHLVQHVNPTYNCGNLSKVNMLVVTLYITSFIALNAAQSAPQYKNKSSETRAVIFSYKVCTNNKIIHHILFSKVLKYWISNYLYQKNFMNNYSSNEVIIKQTLMTL